MYNSFVINLFYTNLDQSYQSWQEAPNRKAFIDGHWLNADGTVSVKIGFLKNIYWVRDLFYDKTSRDIYAMYKKCVGNYCQTINEYRGLRDREVSAFTQGLEPLTHRIELVSSFLQSRQIPQSQVNEYQSLKYDTEHALDFLNKEKFNDNAAPQLTERGLQVGPVNAELDLSIASNDPNYPLEDLLILFNGAIPNLENEADDDYKTAIETRLLQAIQRRDIAFLGYDETMPPAFYDQLNHVLKNIIFELEQANVLLNKQCEVLRCLGDAAHNHPLMWLEEAVYQYKSLTLCKTPLRARVLFWIQTLKEKIIYQDLDNKLQELIQIITPGQSYHFFLDGVIHLLNHFRLSDAGVLYKLDRSTASLDPTTTGWFFIVQWYFGMTKGWIFPNNYLRDLFLQNLTPEDLIHEVATQMEAERENWPQCARETHEFLLNVVKSVYPNMENPEDYVSQTYYDEQHRINFTGILRILRELTVCD